MNWGHPVSRVSWGLRCRQCHFHYDVNAAAAELTHKPAALPSPHWLLPAGTQPWMQPHLPSYHLPASRETGQTVRTGGPSGVRQDRDRGEGRGAVQQGLGPLLQCRLLWQCMIRLAGDKKSPEAGESKHQPNSNFMTVLSCLAPGRRWYKVFSKMLKIYLDSCSYKGIRLVLFWVMFRRSDKHVWFSVTLSWITLNDRSPGPAHVGCHNFCCSSELYDLKLDLVPSSVSYVGNVNYCTTFPNFTLIFFDLQSWVSGQRAFSCEAVKILWVQQSHLFLFWMVLCWFWQVDMKGQRNQIREDKAATLHLFWTVACQ